MRNVKSGHTRPIVCLDAGHYGKYNRSPAVKDYYESDMVWKLHLLQKAELEKYGIEVRLTRTEQAKDLALTTRGKASDGCDLFISDHSNAVGNVVNESVDRPVAIVQLDGKGNELGEALVKTIREVMGTNQAGRVTTRKGNGGEYYGVLRGAAAVGTIGMILEHSFHTNTRATKWLMDDTNLQALAAAEAKTIAGWFDVTEVAGSTETSTEAQDEPDATAKYYRIRKSWNDAASQTGAFLSLENAKAACLNGYTVYDWNGNAVYTPGGEVPQPDTVKIDAAASGPVKAKAGKYKVESPDGTLNLRAGASTSKTLIEVMPNGTVVRCYGYYTGDWLFVVSASGKRGFCHRSYLRKI